MKPFVAISDTVARLLDAREHPVWMSPQLNFTSRWAPHTREDSSREVVQVAVGERVIRLVGTFARRAVTVNPEARRVLVVTRDHKFIPKLEHDLVERIGLVPERAVTGEVLRDLAEDFYRWASEEPSARDDFGVEVDHSTSQIFVRCPNLAARATPLG